VLDPRSTLAAHPERAKIYIARSWPTERLARRAQAALAWATSATRVVRALGAGRAKRWLAPAALLCAAAIVALLALVQLPGGGQARHLAPHDRPLGMAVSAAQHSHAHPATSDSRSAVGSPPQPARHPAPPPVSAVLAAQLDTEGHDLLEAGRYGDAVVVLQRTLMATGEHVQDCLQPASETCLTYAYALYDLGSALRLDGHPAAAVPILQRRLQINNQRATVQAQLELALAQTS
jgi:hypothetical protein